LFGNHGKPLSFLQNYFAQRFVRDPNG